MDFRVCRLFTHPHMRSTNPSTHHWTPKVVEKSALSLDPSAAPVPSVVVAVAGHTDVEAGASSPPEFTGSSEPLGPPVVGLGSGSRAQSSPAQTQARVRILRANRRRSGGTMSERWEKTHLGRKGALRMATRCR